MSEKELNFVATATAVDQLRELRDIHREVVLLFAKGVSTEVYAEVHGVNDVAHETVDAAVNAAREIYENDINDRHSAAEAARAAVRTTINVARKKDLLFLRDGTQSATVLLAYDLACTLFGYAEHAYEKEKTELYESKSVV